MAPRFTGAEYGVQGDDEFSHDGGDNDFAGLAAPSEFIGEEAHDGVMLDGEERRHVDMARALERAAIVVDWRKARDTGGLALCECAQFGHVSQDGRDGRRADALERLHEPRFARERLAGFDMRRDLGLKRCQGFAKAGDMRFKASADAGVAGMLHPVGFGEEHLLELVAPGFQVSERQNLGRRRNIDAKIRGLKPIEGKNAGVDRIGLGEKAEIPGEMANARSALCAAIPSSSQTSRTWRS